MQAGWLKRFGVPADSELPFSKDCVEHRWWFERWSGRSRRAYVAGAATISVLYVVLAYLVSREHEWLPWDLYTIATVSAMAACLALQLVALPPLVGRARRTLARLIPVSHERAEAAGVCVGYLSVTGWCPRFWATYLLVSAPFFSLFLLLLYQSGGLPFYSVKPTFLVLVFDIASQLIHFTLLYFLAATMWVLFVITWIISRQQTDRRWNALPIQPYSTDGVAGLGSLHGILRRLLTVYFFSAILLTTSTINPTTFWSIDSMVVLALLAIGIGFTIFGFSSINVVIRKNLECRIQDINARIAELYQGLEEETAEIPPEERMSMIDTKTRIDLLNDERQRLLDLSSKNNAFNAQVILSPGVPALLFVISQTAAMNGFLMFIRTYVLN